MYALFYLREMRYIELFRFYENFENSFTCEIIFYHVLTDIRIIIGNAATISSVKHLLKNITKKQGYILHLLKVCDSLSPPEPANPILKIIVNDF